MTLPVTAVPTVITKNFLELVVLIWLLYWFFVLKSKLSKLLFFKQLSDTQVTIGGSVER